MQEINSVLQASVSQSKAAIQCAPSEDFLTIEKTSEEESLSKVGAQLNVEDKADLEVYSEETVVDIATDIEPDPEKPSTGNDEEFFDAENDNE